MKRAGALAGVAVLVLCAGVALAGPNKGKVRFIQQLRDNFDGVDGLGAVRDLGVSPDGKHLYATALSDHAIATFRRRRDGTLKYQRKLVAGMDAPGMTFPGDLEISRDGRFVYVASPDSSSVIVLRRNKAGKLTYSSRLQDLVTLQAALGLAISPDDRFLYVTTSEFDADLVVLKRNRRSGKLKLVTSYEGADPELELLRNPGPPVISPDGKTLYVSTHADSSVIAMKRNKRTGRLKEIDRETDDVTGVNGILNAYRLMVSPDDKHVYVMGTGEQGIATFKRGKGGRLTFVNAVLNAGNAMSVPYDGLVSKDGKNVYVIAYGSDALVVFKRNRRSGKLTFRQARKSTASYDFDGSWRLAASANTRDIYVGSLDGDRVLVLKRQR